ncbi:circularly permuted type 2 ATP-grasp protein [Pseudomarimonas salicorniae]|uniref:Circularly permuted type 2 ATP-grasp protein n=1 Tax=Pseudomarimonas salicorniae TaxID=2933270 RepID=A0ABT0GJT0_9GAMM|nr:circularly permuted type 2 ATP-grasp protein [Lysobacter sp. CAU 1642]MCK7594788.1 circularly permuted type 2 ATP-grasp protein [Lysobacter sp. CAU 1642]
MHPLLARYRPARDRYDELCLDEGGRPRAHWQSLIRRLQQIPPEGLRERCEFVARQIQENGVTYNVYADPKGDARPWDLDMLPQLITSEEWAPLAAGIAQRAGLLERVLADLYGEQTLLSGGLLPPDLVFGHGNFLWPAQGVRPRGDAWLHVYAADLARAPDGRWWVLADRTQTPSGAGYALENRHIVGRAFPELFRELGIRRLDGFFDALHESLLQRCEDDGEPPLIVLLTPGRFNETYFEHVFLARQLGFPLVEGQDLTVRDATVYLKTLGGLQRVHAILRRLDDDWCDPLELRADSALGVPGLLDAVRAQRVVVANALGSGVLESPGLMGFLPAIAEKWLGEPLSLPSVATWWCGEEATLRDALRKLPQLVIKGAYPSQGFEPVYGADLDRAGLRALRARLRRRPGAYVAQEQVHLSQAPVWPGDGSDALVARAVTMRVYAVATSEGFQVMPGGLTRVAQPGGAEVVSMQRGGSSKDTWVFADAPQRAAPSLRRIDSVVRRDPHLLSRTVENLFWLGRYAERCDVHARLLRSLLNRIDDDLDPQVFEMGLGLARQLGRVPTGGADAADLLRAIADVDWENSLHVNLRRLCWSASEVRARLSMENWRTVMEIQRDAASLGAAGFGEGRASAFLNRLLTALSALSGFALDDMTRDDSWRFLMVGRSLERLQAQIAQVLPLLEGPPRDAAALGWWLELGNVTITYRSRYLASPQLMPVLDLLLLDEDNPHAMLFQLERLTATLAQIGFSAAPEGAIEGLEGTRERLRSFEVSGLLAGPGSEPARELSVLLGALSTALHVLSERLVARYFAQVDDHSQMTWST